MKRILMVPDAFIGPDSGAAAARYAAKLWQDIGCEVIVYAPCNDNIDAQQLSGITFIARQTHRTIDHIRNGTAVKEFEKILEETQPTHVFLLGSSTSKPAGFFTACRKRSIRTIAMWWTQDFYCERSYGCLLNGPCDLCIRGNYLSAFQHQCSYTEEKAPYSKLLVRTVSRMKQRAELLACDVTMGSSEAQLKLYRDYGIDTTKLVKCPLFFDAQNKFRGVDLQFDNYFVCYGQSRFEKGWHLLKDIIDRCENTKFVIPFANAQSVTKVVSKFNLQNLVEQKKLQIIEGITWNTGVNKIVAQARGILIPSVWPTTTEYTFLESIGLGKPVIVFDVGIHKEIIQHGENGMLAQLGDVDAMANHVKTLAQDDILCTKVAKGAFQLFEKITNKASYHKAFQEALKKSV